jgi:competence protein ComFB
MHVRERYDFEKLRNRTLDMVLHKVERLLEERDDVCHCENCVLDLVAYILNHVTPLYGTSLLDPLHPNQAKEKKVHIEIELALNAGLKRIARNPHHFTGTVAETGTT